MKVKTLNLDGTLSTKSKEKVYNNSEIEKAYHILSFYGIPKERAKSIANGIKVLVTRFNKEIYFLKQKIFDLKIKGDLK